MPRSTTETARATLDRPGSWHSHVRHCAVVRVRVWLNAASAPSCRASSRDEFVPLYEGRRLLRAGCIGLGRSYFDFSYDGALRSLAESLGRPGSTGSMLRSCMTRPTTPEGAGRRLPRTDPTARRERACYRHRHEQTVLLARFAREGDPIASLSPAATRFSTQRRESCCLCAKNAASTSSPAAFSTAVSSPRQHVRLDTASVRNRRARRATTKTCASLRGALAAAQFSTRCDTGVKTIVVGCRRPPRSRRIFVCRCSTSRGVVGGDRVIRRLASALLGPGARALPLDDRRTARRYGPDDLEPLLRENG